MAKKKSLFKKLRKSESSMVAEPEAPVDDAILEAIAKPKIEEVVRPAIIRKPYVAPAKTYPTVIDIEVNKSDIFGALDLAKKAAIEDAGKSEYVGEFYSIDSDEDRVATYLFEAKLPGYHGWRWGVTVVKIDDASKPTICDVVLLPGTYQAHKLYLHRTGFLTHKEFNQEILVLAMLYQLRQMMRD